jgi:hypothetical protein
MHILEFGDHLLSGQTIGQGGAVTSCIAEGAFESGMVSVVEGTLLNIVETSASG